MGHFEDHVVLLFRDVDASKIPSFTAPHKESPHFFVSVQINTPVLDAKKNLDSNLDFMFKSCNGFSNTNFIMRI